MADDKLVERLRYAAKPHQSSPLERDTLLAQAADRIEALGRVIDDALGHLEAGEPAEAAVILQTRRHHAREARDGR